MRLQVEMSESTRNGEQPSGFFLGDKHIDVVQVIDRWLSVDHVYFKVEAADGSTYILKHDENPDQWELTFFDAGQRIEELPKRASNYLN